MRKILASLLAVSLIASMSMQALASEPDAGAAKETPKTNQTAQTAGETHEANETNQTTEETPEASKTTETKEEPGAATETKETQEAAAAAEKTKESVGEDVKEGAAGESGQEGATAPDAGVSAISAAEPLGDPVPAADITYPIILQDNAPKNGELGDGFWSWTGQGKVLMLLGCNINVTLKDNEDFLFVLPDGAIIAPEESSITVENGAAFHCSGNLTLATGETGVPAGSTLTIKTSGGNAIEATGSITCDNFPLKIETSGGGSGIVAEGDITLKDSSVSVKTNDTSPDVAVHGISSETGKVEVTGGGLSVSGKTDIAVRAKNDVTINDTNVSINLEEGGFGISSDSGVTVAEGSAVTVDGKLNTAIDGGQNGVTIDTSEGDVTVDVPADASYTFANSSNSSGNITNSAKVTGDGQANLSGKINNAKLDVENGATVAVAEAAKLEVNGYSTVTNNGTLAVSGEVANKGEIVNKGKLEADGKVSNDGKIANIGNIELNQGATLENNKTIDNNSGASIVNNSGATINNSSGASIENKDGATIKNEGKIEAQEGATIKNEGKIDTVKDGITGTVTGGGTTEEIVPKPTPTPSPTPSVTPQSSGGGGGGGGSGSGKGQSVFQKTTSAINGILKQLYTGGKTGVTAGTAVAAGGTPVTAAQTEKALAEAVARAKAQGGKTVNVLFQNASVVGSDALEIMAAKGVETGMPVSVSVDTMKDGAVDVRVTVPVTDSIKALNLRASTGGEAIEEHFAKYFTNRVRVVSMEAKGPFGAAAQVAARLDLRGMDISALHFYMFDSEANAYRELVQENYFVDQNGYLHFTTDVGGCIVISDGPLTRK